jgi:hypothetical protein
MPLTGEREFGFDRKHLPIGSIPLTNAPDEHAYVETLHDENGKINYKPL